MDWNSPPGFSSWSRGCCGCRRRLGYCRMTVVIMVLLSANLVASTLDSSTQSPCRLLSAITEQLERRVICFPKCRVALCTSFSGSVNPPSPLPQAEIDR
jgi:hypothetical protein